MKQARRTTDDLQDYLDAVDVIYFDGHLSEMGVTIKWLPPRRPKTMPLVAHYLHDERRIELSRTLAFPWVPRQYVLQTIFHEALHALLGPEHDTHTKTFHLSEKQFVYSFEAREWERDNRRKLVRSPEPKGVV